MSIQKNTRGGDGYIVRHRVRGKRLSAVVQTKKMAEALERKWKDEAAARNFGLPVERDPITLDELCERYLAQHQVTGRTLRTLRERLAYSRDAFADANVRELQAEEIASWNARLPKMRRQALAALRQVLAAGVRWEYLTRNPASVVKLPPPVPTDVRPFESWADVGAVAEAAGTFGGVQATALVQFATATGLRPQEWQALPWRDLDLTGHVVHVRQTLRDGGIVTVAKTEAAVRTVSLQSRAVWALDRLARPINRDALVFRSPDGCLINLSNWRRRVWFPALDAAGLDRRPIYQMRHTFATLALAAGVPIEWVARQLGHRDTRVTLRHYARWLPATDERWLDALDAFASADQSGRIADARCDA